MSLTRIFLLLTGPLLYPAAGAVTAVSGGNVTFSVAFSGAPSYINWMFQSNKLVDLSRDAPADYYSDWGARAAGDMTGYLTIRDLQLRDSGLYQAEVIIDGEIQTTNFPLTVYHAVAPPIITNSTHSNNITLQCTCPTPGVTYRWLDAKGNVTSTGQNLTMTRIPGDPQTTMTCTAENPASNNSATITLPAVPVPDPDRSHTVLVVCLVLVCVAAVGFVIYCFKKPAECLRCSHSDKKRDSLDSGVYKPTRETNTAEEQQKLIEVTAEGSHNGRPAGPNTGSAGPAVSVSGVNPPDLNLAGTGTQDTAGNGQSSIEPNAHPAGPNSDSADPAVPELEEITPASDLKLPADQQQVKTTGTEGKKPGIQSQDTAEELQPSTAQNGHPAGFNTGSAGPEGSVTPDTAGNGQSSIEPNAHPAGSNSDSADPAVPEPGAVTPVPDLKSPADQQLTTTGTQEKMSQDPAEERQPSFTQNGHPARSNSSGPVVRDTEKQEVNNSENHEQDQSEDETSNNC